MPESEAPKEARPGTQATQEVAAPARGFILNPSLEDQQTAEAGAEPVYQEVRVMQQKQSQLIPSKDEPRSTLLKHKPQLELHTASQEAEKLYQMYTGKNKCARFIGNVLLAGSVVFYVALPAMVGRYLVITTENRSDESKYQDDLNELRNWALAAIAVSVVCELLQSCIFKITGKQIS